MSDMIYKGYSRIFVSSAAHIGPVLDILREIDPMEVEDYMPDKLIAVLTDDPHLVYNGKFDLEHDVFYRKCLGKGIPAWVVTSHEDSL